MNTRALLCTFIAIPLKLGSGWGTLEFAEITPNKVIFKNETLTLQIRKSASPLIFRLNPPQRIREIIVKGSLSGLPKLPLGSTQGDPNADDFAFRIGFIFEGQHRLSFFDALIAPTWISTLYDMAPEGQGISEILFFNLANAPPPYWTERQHPSNELIRERIVGSLKGAGPFQMKKKVSNPNPLLALWVSVDGDNTESSFDLTISSIKIELAKP